MEMITENVIEKITKDFAIKKFDLAIKGFKQAKWAVCGTASRIYKNSPHTVPVSHLLTIDRNNIAVCFTTSCLSEKYKNITDGKSNVSFTIVNDTGGITLKGVLYSINSIPEITNTDIWEEFKKTQRGTVEKYSTLVEERFIISHMYSVKMWEYVKEFDGVPIIHKFRFFPKGYSFDESVVDYEAYDASGKKVKEFFKIPVNL